MNTKVLLQGQRADLLVYVSENGRVPVQEFADGLQHRDKAKLFQLFRQFGSEGEIQNRERFTKEEGPIFAFKPFKIRVYCFYFPDAPKRTLVLTHGCMKKQDKADPVQLEKAKAIYTIITKRKP